MAGRSRSSPTAARWSRTSPTARHTTRKDRRGAREDENQVYLLPLDGGEARRLTDLPRGVDAFEWSPDGTRLVVVSASRGATRADDDRRRGIDRTAESSARTPPPSDYRFVDRLDYMLNGAGFTYDKVTHLWLVDVVTGEATRLTDGRAADGEPAWSPDGRRIAFTSNRRRDADLLTSRLDIHVVDVETRAVTAVTRGPRSMFFAPTWLPDGDHDRGPWSSDRGWGRESQRHLAVRGRRFGRDAIRRPEPVRGARPDARLRDEQRRDARRGPAAHPLEGWPLARLHGADRRRVRAVADRRRPTAGSNGSRRGATTSRAGTRSRTSPASRVRGSPTCARRRPRRPTCGCSRCRAGRHRRSRDA